MSVAAPLAADAAILPLAWRPPHAGGLVRVGPDEDGGYVIRAAALDGTRHLVGGGLSDDWRFEADFAARTGASITVYDPTVGSKFWIKRLYAGVKSPRRRPLARTLGRMRDYRRFFDGVTRRHVRQYIGYDDGRSASVRAMLRTADGGADHFLKLDIEGSEYRILDDIVAYRARLSGLVIEFHDVSAHRLVIDRFVAAMAPDFEIAHVHANNFAGRSPDGLPIAVELTFGRPSDRGADAPAAATYPLAGLDQPCNAAAPDLSLHFA